MDVIVHVQPVVHQIASVIVMLRLFIFLQTQYNLHSILPNHLFDHHHRFYLSCVTCGVCVSIFYNMSKRASDTTIENGMSRL